MMEEKKCLGCGAILQYENSEEIGYSPKQGADYCQRCFKMIHYDSHKDHDFLPNNDLVIEQLSKLEGEYVWIMDIFDFDTSLQSVLVDFFKDRPCNIVLNKCDLLPDSMNYEKLGNYVLKRIKALGVKSKAILTRGVNRDFIENFDEYIYNQSKPAILCGIANVGKSTIINNLLKDNIVTTNRYPATTINVNELHTDKYHIIDTVGIVPSGSVQLYLTNKELKQVVPVKTIRPSVFQIYSNQTISLGGICRIDVLDCHDASIVVYTSNLLDVKRNKYENADKFWNNGYGIDLKPTLKGCDSFKDMKKTTFKHSGKKDYFISGLGFVTINAKHANVHVYCDKRINIICREAMV